MPKARDPEDLIRELLVRELDTVNVYTEMVDRARTPAVRELLVEITRQEKHHIGEAVDMLSRYDAGQAEALEHAGLGRRTARPAGSIPVIFEPVGVSTTCAAGDRLLDIAEAAGVEIRHDCGGHGICGTCRVQVLEGTASLSESTDPESRHLDNLLPEGWRLSCQSEVYGPVAVLVPLQSGSGEE